MHSKISDQPQNPYMEARNAGPLAARATFLKAALRSSWGTIANAQGTGTLRMQSRSLKARAAASPPSMSPQPAPISRSVQLEMWFGPLPAPFPCDEGERGKPENLKNGIVGGVCVTTFWLYPQSRARTPDEDLEAETALTKHRFGGSTAAHARRGAPQSIRKGYAAQQPTPQPIDLKHIFRT